MSRGAETMKFFSFFLILMISGCCWFCIERKTGTLRFISDNCVSYGNNIFQLDSKEASLMFRSIAMRNDNIILENVCAVPIYSLSRVISEVHKFDYVNFSIKVDDEIGAVPFYSGPPEDQMLRYDGANNQIEVKLEPGKGKENIDYQEESYLLLVYWPESQGADLVKWFKWFIEHGGKDIFVTSH